MKLGDVSPKKNFYEECSDGGSKYLMVNNHPVLFYLTLTDEVKELAAHHLYPIYAVQHDEKSIFKLNKISRDVEERLVGYIVSNVDLIDNDSDDLEVLDFSWTIPPHTNTKDYNKFIKLEGGK